jgi:hypothetical protein
MWPLVMLLSTTAGRKVTNQAGKISAFETFRQETEMHSEWSVESDSDLLEMLTVDLKIANKIHRTRVLLELKKLWAPSW